MLKLIRKASLITQMDQLQSPSIGVTQDTDASITVIRHVAEWLQKTGLETDGWWDPANMNLDFLGQYAKPDEFYVAIVDGEPAAAAIIQQEQTAQDWSSVDEGSTPPAMYLHWLAVEREHSGEGLPKVLIDHAEELARQKGLPVIRLDTNADEPKLCKIYEELGFKRVNVISEAGHNTALYEKTVESSI
jgi:ribosomal protein S18 acetylase RimI-like enzyme